MKYKVIVLTVMVLLIVVTVVFSRFEFKNKRYHQHIEADVREEDVVTRDEFATHLPIIKIETDEDIPEPYIINENGKIEIDEYGSRKQNNETVEATVDYIDAIKQNKNIVNTSIFKSNAKIRIRGNSSRGFDKKSYKLRFMNNDFTEDRKISIDGMTADSEWVLHGPYMDKTLLRNYLCYNLAGESLNLFSPEVRYCELFINGNYEGLYLIVEEIVYNDIGRINITESDPDSSETSFILKIDKKSDKEEENMRSFFYETYRRSGKNVNNVSIVYPGSSMTKEQYEYIEETYLEIEKMIVSTEMPDYNKGYRKYIDVDSFVDYYIFNEFTINTDATNLSTFLYYDLKNKKISLAIWDYNNVFGNFIRNEDINKFVLTDKWWYKYLLKDDEFTRKVIDRYRQLRKTILSDEYIINYIDETVDYLGPAIDRNYERWPKGISEEMMIPAESNQHSYEEAVNYLKERVVARGKFLDENIEAIKFYSHESNNK